ncbi:MAG: DUF6531 domain-containing protein, partial [Chloroflexota bacterium]
MSGYHHRSLQIVDKAFRCIMLVIMLLSSSLGSPVARAAEAESNRLPSTTSDYQAPAFTRPEPVVGESMADSVASLEQTETARLVCPNVEGIPCTDTNPGIMLTQVQDVSQVMGNSNLPDHFKFRILCDGLNCYKRDIYYHTVLYVKWSAPSWWYHYTKVYLMAMTGTYYGTGHLTNIACGTGFSGECLVETWGVIDGNRFQSPNFLVGGGWYWCGTWANICKNDTVHKLMTVEVSLSPLLIGDEITPESTYCGNPCSDLSSATGFVANPINTRTGVMSYVADDVSISTSAGMLDFRHIYVSDTTDSYTGLLGYGWTHSLDSRLIFSTDPLGQPGFVLFKDFYGNMVRFWDMGAGRYTAYSGITKTLTRNPGPPVTYTLRDSSQNVYVFDSSGKLLTWTNSRGMSFVYSYDGTGRLDRVSADDMTRYLDLDYDGQGRIGSVADHSGRAVIFGYDTNGDLSAVTDVLGQVWGYRYDQAHRLTEVLDPDGVTIERTEYDDQGRAVRQWDGNGDLVVEIVYNPDGSTTVTNSLGNTETHAYDERNALIGVTDPLQASVEKTFDFNFRPQTITDPAGNTTTLAWSSNGVNLTRITDPAGGVTQISYDPLNNPISVVDPLGYLTSFTYSGTLLTSVRDSLGGVTSYTYTAEGYLASVTDPAGNTTTYTYDSFGQRTSLTDPAGNTWTYTYDNLGRLVETIHPLGRVTLNEYDPAGRLVRLTRNYDPGRPQNDQGQYNLVSEYEYDLYGRQTAVTDTFGRTTRYEYDLAGRLTRTIDPQGNETVNTYDTAGQLTAVTDPLGRTTTYSYDPAGRLVTITDPLGHQTHTAYNPDGTVAASSDALDRTTGYTYDTMGRVIAVTDPLGGVMRTTYNLAGNVTTSTDPAGNVTRFIYDSLGRQIVVIDPLGGETQTYYNSLGQRVQTVDPLNNATTYTYDEYGRLIAVTNAPGDVTGYEYDSLGRRRVVIDPRGNRTRYAYDALDRVVAVTDPFNSTST